MIHSMDTTPRLSWKAVAVGALVDQGGSIVMAIVVAVVSGVLGAVQTGVATSRAPRAEAAGQLIYEILSIAFVVLGGLVAARMARTLMVLHGLAVGVASLIGAFILGMLMGADFGEPGRAVFFAILTLVAGPLGGAIGLLFGVPKPSPAGVRTMPPPRPAAPAQPAAPVPAPTPAAAPGLWVDLREARNQPSIYRE
jgi:putative membrane protein (TIGR04086 family)